MPLAVMESFAAAAQSQQQSHKGNTPPTFLLRQVAALEKPQAPL